MSDAELLELLRDISPNEQLALRNVHEMAVLATQDAIRRFRPVFNPARHAEQFAREAEEFQRYIRGFFCLTLQLGATHHDERAKRLAAKAKS